jgi:Cys-tRNA(Pro)/Cys-tRNA(Cys) deacylase
MKRKIAFEVVRYKHLEKGAEFAAQAIGFKLARTIKTLVVTTASGSFALALVPGSGQLSPKRMARAMGVKQIVMADTAAAERQTGYKVGGISPFATQQRMPVVMDEMLLEYDQVTINAGQRGVMLIMAPSVIQMVLSASVAAITNG